VDTCPKCSAPTSLALRYCTTCTHDLGAPNCREAADPVEREALRDREKQARLSATERGVGAEYASLHASLTASSGVVVCMPPIVARLISEDPRQIYSNYETLVGAGVRKPAPTTSDRERGSVAGLLFGSYANRVVYGALSLGDRGPHTYGAIACRLRGETISSRVSFLERNSYRFVQQHGLAPGRPVPAGFRSVWDNRADLAATKLANGLKANQTAKDWDLALLSSDGENRGEEDFVEAHIFDGFDVHAVASLKLIGTNLARSERLDAELALDAFAQLSARRPA
jgi:hypothetical protein